MAKSQRPPDPTELIAFVDGVKARFDGGAALTPMQRSALRRTALVESVASAGRLDGSPRSDERVTVQLSHPEQARPVTVDEQLAAGLLEALERVHESARVMPVSTTTMEQLHGLVTRQAGDGGPIWRTRYVALTTLGPGGARVSPPLPEDLPARLAELVALHNHVDASVPPLQRISRAAFDYLELQPFEGISLRLFGTFVTWLLLRAGHEHARFVSFDRLIEEQREACGEALAETHHALWSHHPTTLAWDRFFLGLLVEQARRVERAAAG